MGNIKVMFDYQAYNQRIGGVSRYHTKLMQHLSEYGIDPVLPKILTDNLYIKQLGIPHRQFSQWRFGKYRQRVMAWVNQQICKRAICKNNYDVFHATFVNPYYESCIKNKPIVVTVHDLIQEKSQRVDSKITSIRRLRQLRHADAIVCVSNQTKTDLLDYYPEVANKRISVIYHGNDQNIPQNFGPPLYDIPYLLYVGSREAYKNFPNILHALARMPKEIHLVCTGASFSSSELALIDNLKLSNRVMQRFVSEQELMNLYHYAEAFVYPSTMEGFGIPILEAFRLQCPAIVSDIQCFKEVGGGGIKYFDPLNVEEIKETILSVIYNTSERNSHISYGLERLKLFSWDTSINKHAQLYNELI